MPTRLVKATILSRSEKSKVHAPLVNATIIDCVFYVHSFKRQLEEN